MYLAAIDRLNAAIATELAREQPEALQAMLADYKDKYPRLAGLDSVESDLKQYTALIEALRQRATGPLVAQMRQVSFATPPFKTQYETLLRGEAATGSMCSAVRALARRCLAARRQPAAIDALRQINSGPWAADVAEGRGAQAAGGPRSSPR